MRTSLIVIVSDVEIRQINQPYYTHSLDLFLLIWQTIPVNTLKFEVKNEQNVEIFQECEYFYTSPNSPAEYCWTLIWFLMTETPEGIWSLTDAAIILLTSRGQCGSAEI